jgi:DNA-binding winged helix-turn-helix (wHTH) protein
MEELVEATAATYATASRERDDRRPDVRLFGPFRLDLRDERLWRGDRELKLRRKPFAILRCLAERPRRLVTRKEVIETVWGQIAMCDSLCRTHIGEIRRVLGEEVVETVVGRGYRFLLDVTAERRATPSVRLVEGPPTARLVGRGGEMALLRGVFERTLQEERQMVFVTGDSGIGKTRLVDAFLAQTAVPHGALIVSGSCVEQSGEGEAYQPILAALGAACRGPYGETIVEVLGRHAPTWLAQMPGLVPDEDLQGLLLRVQGATRTRMLRELAGAFDVLAGEGPLVLVLEDVQWADQATVDLLATLGGRREASRAVVIATCRRAELRKGEGLAKTIAQLAARRQALPLHLESWPETAVAEYLTLRFPRNRFPNELAATLHQMTRGNPLLTIAVVDDLERCRVIRGVGGACRLSAGLADVAGRRPDTARQLLDAQMDRLDADEQRILEAASVSGLQFSVGAVACALALSADYVDSVCEGLAINGRFLQLVKAETWPDGTLQSTYGFVHALCRDAAQARVRSATRRVWHRRTAEGFRAVSGPVRSEN